MIEWRVRRVAETGSTNADMAALARSGADEGAVLVADYQTAGRGRLGRAWHAPPGTGLAVSLLLRPADVPAHRWPWLPLLAGDAVVEALESYPGTAATLKWPNDVLLDGRKLAGILVERVDGAVAPAAVVGIGLNVSAAPDEATSLATAGFAEVDRDRLLEVVLDRLARCYEQWRDGRGDPHLWLAAAYRDRCETIGQHVRAELPGGRAVSGRATHVDDDGRLVLQTASGVVVLGAGDVSHVRPHAG
ncbi:MAG: biotin--[acetyl-CoA-carboxylase] ligase [Jiangellaceae bacterium]|nr:biotin--[acetyl-CoA-carboxylase] ligase [Jiangellaceae bacterium]